MKKKALAAFYASLTFITIIGCSKSNNPTTVQNVRTASVFVCELGNFYFGNLRYFDCIASLHSSPIADTATTYIELFREPYKFKSIINYKDYSLYWSTGSGSFPSDTMLFVKMSSNIGSCSGSIKATDSIEILFPLSTDTLRIDSIVTIVWKKNADWYHYIYYLSAYDSLGNLVASTSSIGEGIIKDTTIIIPDSVLIDTINCYYHVQLIIHPFNGPDVRPGMTSNMIGDVAGILFCRGQTWIALLRIYNKNGQYCIHTERNKSGKEYDSWSIINSIENGGNFINKE